LYLPDSDEVIRIDNLMLFPMKAEKDAENLIK
jgi:hypothetical protein